MSHDKEIADLYEKLSKERRERETAQVHPHPAPDLLNLTPYGETARQLHRLEQYTTEVLKAKEIFRQRNKLYADAFTQTGVLGSIVAMTGDFARLQEMVLRNPQHGKQAANEVQDKLRDILNQCIMGLMMIEEDNWIGK